MSTELSKIEGDPTPAELAKLRLPPPISESEKEALEAKIEELTTENAELRKKLENPPEPPSTGFLKRFSPL